MVKVEEAKKLLLNKYKDSEIRDAFDLGTRYLFTLYPKIDRNNEELLLDPFYTVDKVSGKIKEYSPLLNLPEFKKKIKISV